MKNKKITLMFIFILLLLTGVGLSSKYETEINVYYNIYNDSVQNYEPSLSSSSILLTVNTPQIISEGCFYSEYNRSTQNMKKFERNYGNSHEVMLKNLEEGMHTYYIRCGKYNSTLKINLKVRLPVSASEIEFSEEPPLKAGKYEINLQTSKHVSETPSLEYSIGEDKYKQVSLYSTGEKEWSGNVIIPESAGEKVGAFKFEAEDLAGKIGNKIEDGGTFLVDTERPNLVSSIEATGYEGQVRLKWYLEEEVEEFRIYRTKNPNVDYTDYYDSSSGESFVDNGVEKGETYYYRVAGVDEAGNIGKLSREIHATALRGENGTQESGLDPSLRGRVDNAVTEIDLALKDIDNIETSLSEEGEGLFQKIRLDNALESSRSRLKSLKRDVKRYRVQDLDEEELDKKLSSSRIQLEAIRKNIPESVSINKEEEKEGELVEEDIRIGLLEWNSSLSSGKVEESVEATKRLIEERNVKIKSKFYNLEVKYLNGDSEDITLVEESISSDIGKDKKIHFLEIIPKSVAEDVSELTIKNTNYEVIKEDPVVSFTSNTKKITYFKNAEVKISELKDIKTVPIKLAEDVPGITGYFVFEMANNSYFGAIILGIIMIALLGYFIYTKKKSSMDEEIMDSFEKIEKMKDLMARGEKEKAKQIYGSLKKQYAGFSPKKKSRLYEEIKKLKKPKNEKG